MNAELPLVRRYPALARIPRARLGCFPSPVEQATLDGDGPTLWIKRDDLDAEAFGGNKVRALEFLLGGVRAGDVVLTLGGEGSTHVLETAALGTALGARVRAVRWRHEMHPVARAVAERAAMLAEIIGTMPGPVTGFARAALARRPSARWIPAGGTSPLGMLGHVNAALELAEQVSRGELPAPRHVIVPLGSGGTAAGLALGFAIAELDVIVVGARVVPRIAASAARVVWLAGRARAFLSRHAGAPVPRVPRSMVRVVHEMYGGAYGRSTPVAEDAAARLHAITGIRLDGTYSAKAFAAALKIARREQGPTLFWLTFDGRWMGASAASSPR